jgi:hypothetical protein
MNPNAERTETLIENDMSDEEFLDILESHLLENDMSDEEFLDILESHLLENDMSDEEFLDILESHLLKLNADLMALHSQVQESFARMDAMERERT